MSPAPVPPEPADAAKAPSGGRSRATTIFNLVMMAMGAVGLAWMMHSIGWAPFREMLSTNAAWFALILGLDLVALACDAAALNTFMRPEARMIPYWRVLGAQASGRAINVLTPGAGLGEVTKLTMLTSHAPRDRVLSSIVLLNLAEVYISVGVMLIGTPITLLLVELPHVVKVSVGVGLAIIIPAMVALGVLVQRGAISSLVGLARRARLINGDRAKRVKARLVEVDRHIRELQRNRSAGTWKGLIWVGVSKCVTWSSTILMVYAIGVHPRPSVVIGVLSIGVLIQWISSIIPMGLGLADGGNYVLFDLLGATKAQGVVYTMMNRARSVAVALIGLVFMAILQVISRRKRTAIQDKILELRERVEAGTLGDPAAAAEVASEPDRRAPSRAAP